MRNESTNLNLDDSSDDDCSEELCDACTHLEESISESEEQIAEFLARVAADPRPDKKMCIICKSLTRAIMTLYEHREEEPEGLLVASTLLIVQGFHGHNLEIMAKDILGDIFDDVIEQVEEQG